MARWVKQSTSADVPIGPFVDPTDGFTAETALTLTQPDIRLKKNAGAWAQKNAAQTLSHEENGYYEVTLDATDTNTLGLLRLAVNESGALPVFEDFLVVPANVYDSFFSTDLLQVDATQILGDGQSATDLKDFADAGYDPSTNKVEGVKLADLLTALVANAINDAAVADDMNSYSAKVWIIKESTTADHYAVAFYKNGQRVTSGVTSPTIQVIKGSDGTDLIGSTALTEIGSTHRFKKDESTNKLVAGAIYFAVVSATIDGSGRSWDQQIGRDSA